MSAIPDWQSRIDSKRYGRITRAASFSGWRRDMLLYCQGIVRTTKRELEKHYGWHLNRVDFFFLNKREPNSILIRHENRHAIGMCVGLPFAVVRHLKTAAANPEFLKEYLAPGEREDWLWRFGGMMIEHAYLHEFAHALRGHLLYRQRPKGRRQADERSNALDRYLELDADLQALEMWLDITQAADDFPTSETLLFDLHFQRVLTILLLFQVLDLDNQSIRHFRRAGHPPPIHRAMALASAMRATMPRQYALSQTLLENVHHQAFYEASVAAQSAGLTKDRWWGGSSGRRRGVGAYHTYYRRYHDDIEPKLDAFVATLPDDLV
jgi:hypothetical protein